MDAMTPQQAIDALAQMAQVYIGTQPPSVRGAIASVAQQAINLLTEATKPKPPTTDEHPKA